MIWFAIGLLIGAALGAAAVVLVLVPEAQQWVKNRFGGRDA